MNFGKGWNPNLEVSYLQEYREYEAEFLDTVYIRILYFSSEICSSWSFSNIGIYRKYQNLAVLVFRVFLAWGQTRVWISWSFTQPKYWSRSLKFDFDEQRNPIPGSLKNSSSVRSPNFSHQKLKMLGSNSASTERCPLQWRVFLAYFFWYIVERDPKSKKP